ncbi:hydrogen gas-evolving membrane-bound hydrogenase subunit E [Halopseudomonas bauzanensis]|uniref:Multicomponent Na+:H+ antiporter subunit A n=1 Tax=Halopseudomonas bauzanensis TaxID=653930 RepID=A0A1H9V5C6_9GAMM|nr:hydrogen gas-evolving membrane-bound hydrogenase subunit E [Halopseudomonas bauzanensis]SES16925.1 multicomponent Na+:H+ antiporter subunit A [Halopseudomonas bauzanensis]SFM19429.1 multicomponent Na+:H+ antiporter subunit A [Halopseudomonas bauzanensis]
MLISLLGIFINGLCAPFVWRLAHRHAGLLLAVVPAASFIWFALQVPEISRGGALFESLAWVPALNITLGLRLDGLALLFALLITGIGTLIVMYSGAYLRDHRQLGRFYAYLLIFMTAMLGLVLADDLIAMFVFWEATSIASYLLISFNHEKAESRRAALQALLITGGGGLALLAGLVLLGIATDTWQFSQLQSEMVQGHALFPAIMVLVLIGCFTKSAQFPFHLWLPNAMNAPTPVSAYLHSATMVKAGIYLLARLNPTLGGGTGWSTVLITLGALTALLGAVLAIRQYDLKRMLAYTTVTVLGQLTMLIGTNTSYGLQAFVLYLVAHSFYKGALFMAVGAIDHATGTRDIRRLSGLFTLMPLTGIAVGLAAFSNAGLPPFFGFIAKEFKYAGLIEMGSIGWTVTVVMILTNALLVAAAGLIFLKTFLGSPGKLSHSPHEVSPLMWIGPLLLAVGGFGLGAGNQWPEIWLVNTAVQAIASEEVDVGLYLWGGITPAVIASALTLGLGTVFYFKADAVRALANRLGSIWTFSGDLLWDKLLKRLFRFAGAVAALFQHGSLRLHMALMTLVVSICVLFGMLMMKTTPFDGHALSEVSLPGVIGCLLALGGAAGAAFMAGRLALVASLGASGLGLALFFVSINAPDVALTQLMVETLTVVFLAMVLRRMPVVPASGGSGAGANIWHAAVAVVFGLAVTLLIMTAVSQPLPGDLADWFLVNSLPSGYGSNVVNVILVDFRAVDTLGEILVVAIAALAASTLLGVGQPPTAKPRGLPEFSSLMLRQGMRPLAAILFLVSLAILWRGHNLPGGGFIGGLVAATGFTLLIVTFGRGIQRGLARIAPPTIIGLGLACAVGAGLFGLAAELSFMTGLWVAPFGVKLGTPLLFDLGVFLTVFGSVMHMLRNLIGRAV